MTSTKRPRPAALDLDGVWRVIDAQRTSLVNLLEDLSDDEWRQPSLCAGWTVRDVTAHLTQQQLGLRDVLATMAHWRGSMDRTVQYAAIRHATAVSTGQLIAEIRGMVGSRRHIFGGTHLEPFIDIMVHGHDIAIPLGRRYEVPPEAAAVAADRALSMRWPPPLASIRKMAGLRLTATDVEWSAGAGPEVSGPMIALLLICCGRLAALPQLSGDGVGALTARFAAPGPASR